MRDAVNRSILLQATVLVVGGVMLLWATSLLPAVCPAIIGGPPCGPELRQNAASASTLLLVTLGIAAVAAALAAPRDRRQWVFGWGAIVLCAVILAGLGWVVASAGFIVI